MAASFLTFHVEHILAKQHILDDTPENLALACPDCNRYKGPNLTSLKQDTREIIRLFHPRTDSWGEHFEFRGAMILGRTAIGAATVQLLQMNTDGRVEMRAELQANVEM